jgi:hypothetical protein
LRLPKIEVRSLGNIVSEEGEEAGVRAGECAPARPAKPRQELRPAGMNARRKHRPRGAKEPEILPAGPAG